MASVVNKLYHKNLIRCPQYASETVYEVIMGSVAYAVSSDTSDMDVYAVAVPPKRITFPHTDGHIQGFGSKPEIFENYQKHGIVAPDNPNQQYDICIYGLVRYFDLCMGCNPNMVDSLFVPRRCILHSTEIGDLIRLNRKLFLSKQCWKKFAGYAYQQLHKAETKNPTGKRLLTLDENGTDRKYLYHVVRLLNEAEQILTEGDLDLERSKEQLKAIRAGEMTIVDVREMFTAREKLLEEVYHKSEAIPMNPDEQAIKNVLLNCFEIYYGSLDKCISTNSDSTKLVKKIKELIQKAGL